MKKYSKLLILLLTLSMLIPAVMLTAAEVGVEEEWQADIRKLMDEAYAPKATTTLFDHSVPEGAVIDEHAFFVERINGDGITMRIDLGMMSERDLADGEWSAVDAWLEEVVNQAIQGIAVDTASMNHAVITAINEARKNVQTAEGESLPVWAEDSLKLTEATVTIPYYPELSEGINGSGTQKLQEKLIQLGYLDDVADGFYGAKTKAAVEMLEEYVRELEQDVIDALPTQTPIATVKPTATPSPSASVQPTVNPTEAAALTVTLEPIMTAAPTEAPTEEPTEAPTEEPVQEAQVQKTEPAFTPATPVDGIADAMLQAYLYSDDFKVTRGDLGDSGDAVIRLQRRLRNLGYFHGETDGIYSGTTERAVRIFQCYNGLETNGVADVALQELIFSENAKAPDNSLLAQGAVGEEVEKLQKRLRELGFMTGSVDGNFGAGTASGVKALQQYMRDLEEQEIRADAGRMEMLEEKGQDISSLLSVEVNGIADPILQDEFYSDSFPAIPAAMQSGSSGIDVVRLQRRLSALEYFYGVLDGQYGNGTEEAVRLFQKQNALEQSGIAGDDTLSLLFSENAKKAIKPYVLKVSTKDQRVYAYAPDANGEYNQLVRTMKCSTGKDATPTPKGTFTITGPGARWHYFKKFQCWAQYAYYIDGDIMFHSVLYNQKDGPVTQSSVNNLGRKASHGCVRLSVEDAKWIYFNCPQSTKIIVY